MHKDIHVMFVVNVDWFFISHRIAIAESLLKKGYKVTLVTKDTGNKELIEKMGINFISLNISRSGTNVFLEFFLFFKLFFIYLIKKPTIIHHVTLKPVIYGSIICNFLRFNSVVNAISGLGYLFTDKRNSLIKIIIIKLMKFAFYNREFSFIFQNRNDSFELQSLGILSLKNRIFWIKGSGVDLNIFKHSVLPSFEKIIILFPTRMLWDKGVKELREATILLKEKFKDKIQFVLSGMADEENKAGVPSKYLLDWQDDGYVKWIGYHSNMIEVYQSSHIVILPSYREGIPKSLIEACSIGRAIITTNGIGCKECVDDGVNGILVPVKDSFSLANSIINLVSDSSKIQSMGLASRIKAEKEFDINLVIASHHEIYNQFI